MMMRQRIRYRVGGWAAAPLAGLLFLSLLLRAMLAPGLMPAPASQMLAGVPLVICAVAGTRDQDKGALDHRAGIDQALCPFASAHLPVLGESPMPMLAPPAGRPLADGVAVAVSFPRPSAMRGAMSARGPPLGGLVFLISAIGVTL
ncbi:hypothetical protein [Niveispirillum irakense]|uniref:hypothetical protein n=1 Tax=Niveispirillum irakense TaxID=34011 RepID=UPI0012B5B79E|nr:hypothetical protein [Niveispirillum irakense]